MEGVPDTRRGRVVFDMLDLLHGNDTTTTTTTTSPAAADSKNDFDEDYQLFHECPDDLYESRRPGFFEVLTRVAGNIKDLFSRWLPPYSRNRRPLMNALFFGLRDKFTLISEEFGISINTLKEYVKTSTEFLPRMTLPR